MGNKSPRNANQGEAGAASHEPPKPKCHGEFHLQSDFEIECHNKHCCHGIDGGKIIVCPACGKNQGRGRWLCRMCFLAEMNDKDDDDDVEIDTSTNGFQRTGIRLNQEQNLEFVGDFFTIIKMNDQRHREFKERLDENVNKYKNKKAKQR